MALSISSDDQNSAKNKCLGIFRLFGVDIPVETSEELNSEKPDERNTSGGIFRLFSVDIPIETSLNSEKPDERNGNREGEQNILVEKPRRKRLRNSTNSDQVKRKKCNINNSGEEPEPDIPPRIKREIDNIQSQGQQFTQPVFLCKKKLEDSDVVPKKNRLFITKKIETKLINFLRENGVMKLDEKGFDVTAIDGVGNYHDLILSKWRSLDMPVLRKGWCRMIAANDVHKDDFVELWGYKQNYKLQLAVNFKKGENAAQSTSAGSSSIISSVSDGTPT